MPQLNQVVLNKLKADEELHLKIAKGMVVKTRTVREWIRLDDEKLTSEAVVLIIAKYYGLKEEDILLPELEPGSVTA